jgi:hypothetical protein
MLRADSRNRADADKRMPSTPLGDGPEELGSPATALGGSTGKTLVEHPLLRAMHG